MWHISQRGELERPRVYLKRSALEAKREDTAVLGSLEIGLLVKAARERPVNLLTLVGNKKERIRCIEPALLVGYSGRN